MGVYVTADAWLVGPKGYGRRGYRAYVPHPLSGWDPVLAPVAVSAVTGAHGALVRAASLPETHRGAALADWVTARDESIRSSVMEGVAATAEGLAWARYRDQAGRPVTDENDALTLGAAKQVQAAVTLGERMSDGDACTLEDICELHRILFAGTRDRGIGGELRDGPIWVGPAGCLVDDASFVAPPSETVPALLDDLVAYLNSDGHPPVLQAAIVHAQFETIHPFDDGNGRTGRALIQTVLNARGLAHGSVPVSTALGGDIRGYHAALNATRVECSRSDTVSRSVGFRKWLEMFCRVCEDAEQHTSAVVQSVEMIAARWRASASFRTDSAAAALLRVLPSMPVLDSRMVAERLGVTMRTARSAIAALASVGILASVGGRRNQRYTVPEMVALLRSMTPDGGLSPQRETPLAGENLRARETPRAAAALPPAPQPPSVACGYLGPRSKKNCMLPKGHNGQHRYQHPEL